jgi:hypothetical protein
MPKYCEAKKPNKYKTPPKPGEYPGLYTSPLKIEDDMIIYMALIGQLQWLVSFGKFDIASTVDTLSNFRIDPRDGHYERAKRAYGYPSGTKHRVIRYRTTESDYSNVRDVVSQIFDLQNILRYLALPTRSTSYLFGDNNFVTVSPTFPASAIAKHHHSLSCYRIREVIASGIMSEHCNYVTRRPLVNAPFTLAKTYQYIDDQDNPTNQESEDIIIAKGE